MLKGLKMIENYFSEMSVKFKWELHFFSLLSTTASSHVTGMTCPLWCPVGASGMLFGGERNKKLGRWT